MKRFVSLMAVILFSTGLAYAADQGGNSAPAVPPDNSQINKRDEHPSSITAEKQSSDPGDVEITRKIRREITGDDSLSMLAKNVKIITQEGKVTLRGPVNSAEEKEKISKKAEQVAGAGKVQNELEVKGSVTR